MQCRGVDTHCYMLQAIVTVVSGHMMQSTLVIYCHRFRSYDAVYSNPAWTSAPRRWRPGAGAAERRSTSGEWCVASAPRSWPFATSATGFFTFSTRCHRLRRGLVNCNFASELKGALASLGVIAVSSVKSWTHLLLGSAAVVGWPALLCRNTGDDGAGERAPPSKVSLLQLHLFEYTVRRGPCLGV